MTVRSHYLSMWTNTSKLTAEKTLPSWQRKRFRVFGLDGCSWIRRVMFLKYFLFKNIFKRYFFIFFIFIFNTTHEKYQKININLNLKKKISTPEVLSSIFWGHKVKRNQIRYFTTCYLFYINWPTYVGVVKQEQLSRKKDQSMKLVLALLY
jgi:hypothetical protein